METEVRLSVGRADAALLRFDSICDLYDSVFSAPPFHWREDESQLHRARLERLLRDPTFGVSLAEVDDELVGFAYGYTLPGDTARWTRVVGSVSPDVAHERPGRTFVLFDYGVSPNFRGRGVGRALHDDLLRSRTEERATLTVQPTAVQTKQIYEHWNWRYLGYTEGGPDGAAPTFDVYLRDTLGVTVQHAIVGGIQGLPMSALCSSVAARRPFLRMVEM